MTQYLDRADGQIAFDDTGNGPLVILAPSLGDLRAEYRFLVPQLVSAGYRAVPLDVRGHGESSVNWPDYSAAAVGSDILALIRHLGAGPAFVVGTSMSAAAASWAAAEAPNLVAGLVLIGPFVVSNTPPSALKKLLLKVLLARPWGRSAWSKYYATLYPTRPPADLTAYRKALKANLSEPGRFAALRDMVWASKAACEKRLPEVKAPALVVMGSKDPDFSDPIAEAKLVAERLNGTVQMVAGAGHYPHAEMPEQVGPMIIEFLNAVRKESPHVS